MILFISVLSVVISPFSFLILLMWFFYLSFLMSLVNGLSILFIFSKNQLLALLILAVVSFVSFVFICALIFMIYFLLLILGCFISSFLVALDVELGYLFDFSPVSWGSLVLNLPLSTAFTESHRFWVVVFTFSFISMHILNFFYFFCDLLVIQKCVV